MSINDTTLAPVAQRKKRIHPRFSPFSQTYSQSKTLFSSTKKVLNLITFNLLTANPLRLSPRLPTDIPFPGLPTLIPMHTGADQVLILLKP